MPGCGGVCHEELIPQKRDGSTQVRQLLPRLGVAPSKAHLDRDGGRLRRA